MLDPDTLMAMDIDRMTWPRPYYCPWCLRPPITEWGHYKVIHAFECPFGLYIRRRYPHLKECTGLNKLCSCRRYK